MACAPAGSGICGGGMNGSCLCGGVRFTTKGQPRPVIICHCTQCRKQSGHCWAATALPENALHLTKADSLAWYAASDRAKRGFCSNCGAFLFWQATGSDQISFAAGAIDGPTGLTVADEWYLGRRRRQLGCRPDFARQLPVWCQPVFGSRANGRGFGLSLPAMPKDVRPFLRQL